jgi:inosine-uridine nucleoside N-ribohydrolase
MSSNPKRQVIIDTDIGVDDAFAILLALRDPSVEVVALTCLSGNVHIDGTSPMALRLYSNNHVKTIRSLNEAFITWREGRSFCFPLIILPSNVLF